MSARSEATAMQDARARKDAIKREAKSAALSPFDRLPKHVRRVIERCRAGETLCLHLKTTRIESDADNQDWFFEPSGRKAPPEVVRQGDQNRVPGGEQRRTVRGTIADLEGCAVSRKPYKAPREIFAPQPIVQKPILHRCEVCGAWGSFGFGHGRPENARWFCGQHRAVGEEAL